ncbi:glycosyltransferase family 2 protein [Winogradskyella sp. PE311]|uniref:glycosyltransferase family 2 protein n=1 Tax=Winogradskyella sp. PE311 TaxID=3366943 RepID=UPI00397EB529
MLSILIPVYNYNVLPLLEEVHKQAVECNINFEIIVIDDASTEKHYNADQIHALSYTKLICLKQNIGRSSIRNLLAKKAIYDNLLFIDSGTFPKLNTFLTSYLEELDKPVVIGGMIEKENKPQKPFILRWLYTKKREANTNKDVLSSANFLIKKSHIESHPFNEDLKSYGYEDLIFFKNLKTNSIKLHFINNPVIHDGQENATTFIKKTESGLLNLKTLVLSHKPLVDDNKIIKLHRKLKSLHLDYLVATIFKLSKPLLFKNFNSSKPSLILFDFYKLGYFCNIK